VAITGNPGCLAGIIDGEMEENGEGLETGKVHRMVARVCRSRRRKMEAPVHIPRNIVGLQEIERPETDKKKNKKDEQEVSVGVVKG
jgi:hypothetical protein